MMADSKTPEFGVIEKVKLLNKVLGTHTAEYWVKFERLLKDYTAQAVKKAEVAARIDELGEVPLDVSVYPELVQYRISRTAHLMTEQDDLEREDV